MATILLSAAGAAVGSGFGGTVLGLSGAVIGRAVGATIGRSVDQTLLGAGSAAVETGRVDRFRLTGAGEGAPIQKVWGRMRVAGQVIWATRFMENSRRSGGGKGAPQQTSTTFSYSVSLAIALCTGVANGLGRIWADGIEVSSSSLDIRFYSGTEDQLPDAKIEVVEGPDNAPSFRGICYVVIEDLDLTRFGNRVPQFSFEIVRRAQLADSDNVDLAKTIQAVALIPGTGEYALATTPVYYNDGLGASTTANVHTVEGQTDFKVSMNQLDQELPNCASVSLVVSWFGNDLRCNQCQIMPKVEQIGRDGVGMPWVVTGVSRPQAATVATLAGRSIYGGTPADQSVIEAIAAIRAAGKEVMFYPFILMEQLDGNGLPDPWSNNSSQPALPWRGRITLSKAPTLAGSPDRTLAANLEIAAFLGAALPSDFSIIGQQVHYSGSLDWGYRRFILHYAHLCALAGGVDAFCIGSELRSLTQARGQNDGFPMVVALRQLAAEVRTILGSGTKISYAADWSEYFGYHVDQNVYFNMDPLWSDSNIDFVGIDNYMPLSDWRDGDSHLDAYWGSIYNLDYLMANITGGEGYDWYYDSPEGVESQYRRPILDTAYAESWVFRYKDLAGWWSHDHHDRIDGVRQPAPTAWTPGAKPIRFTEYGCAALDKASNEPNRFLDIRSSESDLPRSSNGRRDDVIQMQYYRAIWSYWSQSSNNPVSNSYGGQMLDLARCHAWAWDARPFPEFPGNVSVWADGDNYSKGHWLNGRASSQPLSIVILEICEGAGLVGKVDIGEAYGVVRGYSLLDTGPARAALQPFAMVYGIDSRERDGLLQFYVRKDGPVAALDQGYFALGQNLEGALEAHRLSSADVVNRMSLTYVAAESDFQVQTAEAIYPGDTNLVSATSELQLQLTAAEARSVVERWLAEIRASRDTVKFALPKSALSHGVGDIVGIGDQIFRLDRVELSESQLIEATRIDLGAFSPGDDVDDSDVRTTPKVSLPVFPLFLDLPLLTGDEIPQAPHIAVSASPWPGPVAVWSGLNDAGFTLNTKVDVPAIMGVTETPLLAAMPGMWDRGLSVQVKLILGELASVSEADVLSGLNVAAIGDGSTENWEIIQFATVQLISPRTYRLSTRLRGQAGSDGTMPAVWPTGSYFVLLDSLVPQIKLPLSARRLYRSYRIGDAGLGYSDRNVVAEEQSFNGIGLRPYSVSHLAAAKTDVSDLVISWIRRTRLDGDPWLETEVPLGEDSESYVLRFSHIGTILREVQVSVPGWTYTASMQTTDGAVGPLDISVAQISSRFGPGPFKTVTIAVL